MSAGQRAGRSATRAATLAESLDLVLSGRSRVAAARLADRHDCWSLALGAVCAFLARDFDIAADLAVRARRDAPPDGPDAALLAAAGWGLAVAGGGAAVGGLGGWIGPEGRTAEEMGARPSDLDPLGHALALMRRPEPGDDVATFSAYALAEAALACGRLELGARFLEAAGPQDGAFLDRGGVAHPYVVVMAIMRVRLLAFRGRISEAVEELARIRVETADARTTAGAPPITDVLLSATEVLVRGNAAERAGVRALADRVESARPVPDDQLSSGCYLLAAFGLVAIGDVRRAARFALRAGSDERFSAFAVIDRGLAIELMVAVAAQDLDLDAAEAWDAVAEPLLTCPMADSTAQRVRSRVELLRGDAAAAAAWADRAVASARSQGRLVEAAEGEILAARASIAASHTGLASLRLEALVDEAESAGHHAARRAAARELRAAGRRLRPTAGSDWQGLSHRERDIALMLAEGLSNREIAHDLHLSEHTVRAHVSRVLAAFGSASRFGVAARVGELFPAPPSAAPAPLTPRQESVADCIARGLGNAEIGVHLDLSVKTVEKHIGEILRRWDVTSRVGIARIWRSRVSSVAAAVGASRPGHDGGQAPDRSDREA